MTLTPVAERLAVGPSLPVFFDLGLSRPEIETRSPACEVNALPIRDRGGYCLVENGLLMLTYLCHN